VNRFLTFAYCGVFGAFVHYGLYGVAATFGLLLIAGTLLGIYEQLKFKNELDCLRR
jgi:hypothetical protein